MIDAAFPVNAADPFDRQGHDVGDVVLHEPLEALLDPDDVDALHARPDRRRSDHAVDTRRGAAAHDDCQSLLMFHVLPCLHEMK